MKKTLIALAVAASAVVSGSAMAWEANGTGGSVNIGGSLTPAENVTPWEVKIGEAVNGMDANISKGQSVVNISVDNTIPVLGIRTVSKQAHYGKAGITPNIDFQGAIDVNAFNNGVTPLTITVKDKNTDAEIGTLLTKLTAVGVHSYFNADGNTAMFSLGGVNKTNEMFNGGLPTTRAAAISSDQAESTAESIIPGVSDNFDAQGNTEMKAVWWGVTDVEDSKTSSYYASGVEAGNVIKITLNNPVSGDDPIVWKASLPVIVSYQ